MVIPPAEVPLAEYPPAEVLHVWKVPCIGTHVGLSSYSDVPLTLRTDTDESADEHHMRYGVSTGIRGDNDVFGASGARAGAPAVLLAAYQGASQPVFQSAYMGHPVAYIGQTQVVGSDYCPGVPQIAGMPIRALVVTLVLTRAHYNVPKADVCPRDHSASVHPEPRDTLLRDKWLAQYVAKERRENAQEELGSHAHQVDDADPAETGVRFSSQAGILSGAGHGWVPYPDTEKRPGHRSYARPESRTPYQQRAYGPFANPSRLPREEKNDGNYPGAADVRIGAEPVPVIAPYGGEADD